MDTQPNEIITHILSYLDNRLLMLFRRVCRKWKDLIESRIFYKKTIPELSICLLTNNYYHFGKYCLDYNYDTEELYMCGTSMNDIRYYDNLIIMMNNKFFRNRIPQTNRPIHKDYLLIYAAHKNHIEVVKYLIDQGANIHTCNDDAICRSASNGHFQMTQYLVSMGANIWTYNNYVLRRSANNGNLEMVKYLIDQGADIHAQNDDALSASAENGHLDVVKYLIDQGANINYVLHNYTPKVIEFLASLKKN